MKKLKRRFWNYIARGVALHQSMVTVRAESIDPESFRTFALRNSEAIAAAVDKALKDGNHGSLGREIRRCGR